MVEFVPHLKVGVLASGRGSNFQSILDAIQEGRLKAKVCLLITDNPAAFAIERARKHGIEHLVLKPKEFASRDAFYIAVAEELKKKDVGLVVLAGGEILRIAQNDIIAVFNCRVNNSTFLKRY